ncbi:MAG: rod shape-determining protein MreD [Ruminococcaceae bacterium]|nr:rod shape-determining protein MreD [Oscillospiraceae bacterium]
MKILRLLIFTFIIFLVQTTTLKYFSVAGIISNLMLVMPLCFALLKTEFVWAVIYGLLCGILLDCASGTVFGLHALLCTLSAALCSFINKLYFKGTYLVSMLFVFVFGLLYEVLYYAATFAPYYNASMFNVLSSLLIAAIYNAALAPLIFFVMKRIYPIEED